MKLDSELLSSLTIEEIKMEFTNLKNKKYDIVQDKIKIARGCDGVDYIKFEEYIENNALHICDNGRNGLYKFKPFMEIETPKPPYGKDELELARKAGKIRTLSIATIRDTIFQKLLVKSVSTHAEVIFKKNIDMHSFGYRDGKSSKDAVELIRKYIKKGYVHILDGDIKGFFDEIDHELLENKMKTFYGTENPLVQQYLKQFIQVPKILVGGIDAYWQDKTSFEKREKGIPQGGVLSGLLANVFLYDFDLYVVNTLMPKYNFRYLRYADDFVLMFKDGKSIIDVFEQLEKYLSNEKLILHPLPQIYSDPKAKYSKKLDLSQSNKESLDFLGFNISPKYLRVKSDNIVKFRKRIRKTISDIKTTKVGRAYFGLLVTRINKRITALEDDIENEEGLCPHCGKLIRKRSWIGYFMMVTDVRQLRNIDKMIREEIHRDYRIRTNGKRLSDKDFDVNTRKLKSITKTYYTYKKQVRKYGKNGYCSFDAHRYFDRSTWKIKTPPHGEIKDQPK